MLRPHAEWCWQKKRVFVEKKLKRPIIRKKTGKVITKVKIPIWIKRLFLTGEFAFTRAFRCVPVVRGRELTWSVSIQAESEKHLWSVLELRQGTGEVQAWKRWSVMSAKEFPLWLAKVLGTERAEEALAAEGFSTGIEKAPKGRPEASLHPTIEYLKDTKTIL